MDDLPAKYIETLESFLVKEKVHAQATKLLNKCVQESARV